MIVSLGNLVINKREIKEEEINVKFTWFEYILTLNGIVIRKPLAFAKFWKYIIFSLVDQNLTPLKFLLDYAFKY